MTTATILLALAFVGSMLFWTGVGAWMSARFMACHHGQTDHVKRFNRDEDINDVADMSTDGEL